LAYLPTRPSPAKGYNGLPAPSRASPASGSLPPESAAVVCTFIPTLPDELSIMVGETIRILSEYDDGWALCSNARGEIGMVPLECLFHRGLPPDVKVFERRVRTSSLTLAPRQLVGE